MARKRKTDNSNTVNNDQSINMSELNTVQQVFLGEYFNIHTFQYHPVTPNFFKREALKLKEWADLDTSMRISDFYDKQGYAPEVFYVWVDKHPEMKAANEYALRRIGARRETGAMTRMYNAQTIHYTLPHYDPIWRNEMRILNEMRASLPDKNETKIVVIERFPSMESETVSKLTPAEVAANVRKNTGTNRQVRVNANVGDDYEE